MDQHQAIRIGVAERPQEHGVDEAEDRAVGADTERQREHGDQREGRRLRQRAQRLPQVEEQRAHGGFSVGVDGAGDARRPSALGHRVGGSQWNGGKQIGDDAPPGVTAAVRVDHLDEIRLQVVAEPLAELARIGAQEQAVRRPREAMPRHHGLARHEALGLNQRDQS